MIGTVAMLWSRDVVRKMVRRHYWLYRLSRSSIGRNVRIVFPLRREGRGKLSLGEGTVIEANVLLGCGEGSEVHFAEHCRLGEGMSLRAAPGVMIVFRSGCGVGPHTTLEAHADWQVLAGSTIEDHCSIFAREPGPAGGLTIGEGSCISYHSIVDLSDSVTLGREVAIGPHAIIYTHDHERENSPAAAWHGPVVRKPVRICDGAWVGARATILPGVTIGPRAVIAAGAVVTRDVPAGEVVGGIPARSLKAGKASV